MTEKEINIFKDNDIPFADFEIDKDSRFGSDILRGVKEIQAGVGDLSFNVNESGIWLGAKKFMDAPFSVDMHGHVIAGSIALTGYIPTAGAAADINNNVTLINGGKIVTGSINASSMVVGSLRQVFTSTPTTPYAIGDLWSQGSSGDMKRCINSRTTGAYNPSDWDLASKYTDDSNTTTIIGNTVTTGYISTLGLKVGTEIGIGTAFPASSAGDLATLDVVELSKLGSTIIVGGYIKTGLVSADNIIVGTLPTSRTAAKCTDPNADQTSANTAKDSNKVQGYTIISGGYIATGLLTADNITTGKLTGVIVQTSPYNNTGIKMSSSIGGMDVYGETIEIFSTGGVSYGTIGSGGAYLDIASTSNRNIRISPWGGSVFFGLNSGSGIAPTTSGQGNCGLSSQYWANVYTNNLVLSGGNYINYTGGFIQSNSQFRVIGTINLTGNLVFENNASITIGGRTYYQTTGAYDSSKYYLRS